jgi:hypothetical protein
MGEAMKFGFRALTLAVGLLSGSVASGCAASVPMAPAASAQASKTFQPPAGQAALYVYRPDQFKLSAVTVNVKVNGQSFGLLGVGTYLYTALPPGQYTVVSVSEAEAPIVLTAEAGKNYFFQQEIAFGSTAAQTTLVRVDDAQGREAVLKSEMAASQPISAPAAASGCSKDANCKGE